MWNLPGHVLGLSKAPLPSELGKDAFVLNLERVVCGRNCRKTAFSSPFSFSHPPHECCCSPRFSQALSLLYFHGVKEAAGSLGFTCLWGKGRAALRADSSSLLPALWLAPQTMGEGFYPNFAAFLHCSVSWHPSFETGNMTSISCPMSWVLIQFLQGIKEFCGQVLFLFIPPLTHFAAVLGQIISAG